MCTHTACHMRVHTCTEAQGRCALAQQGRGVAGGSSNSGPCNLIPQGWAGPGPLILLSRLPEAWWGRLSRAEAWEPFVTVSQSTQLRAADVLQCLAGSRGWLHHAPPPFPSCSLSEDPGGEADQDEVPGPQPVRSVPRRPRDFPSTAVPTPAFQALTPPACLPSKLAAACAPTQSPDCVPQSRGCGHHPTLASSLQPLRAGAGSLPGS